LNTPRETARILLEIETIAIISELKLITDAKRRKIIDQGRHQVRSPLCLHLTICLAKKSVLEMSPTNLR